MSQPLDLQPDEQALLALLRTDGGGTLGNGNLRDALGLG